MGYDIALTPCRSYERQEVEQALAEALEATGGLDFVRPGMTVALKVNLVTAMKPDRAATVHPEVVRALAAELVCRGAKVIVGDSPGGVFTAPYVRLVYDVCGMTAAAAEAGALLNDDFTQAEADFPAAARARRFPYTAWLGKVDAIIDVCKLKTHGMMGMSCAVKNFFGAIPGTKKPEFHYQYPRTEDFAHMLVDLYEYFAPRLCVCDAVVAMEGNGPTQGTPRPMGCLLVSRSGHLLDRTAAGLIGLGTEDVPTLRAAAERGLLPAEPAVYGDPAVFAVPDFRTVPTQAAVNFHILGGGPLGRLSDRVMERVLTARPRLTASLCVGCGKCAGVCPAEAISMVQGRPSIRRDKCIRCFCCQEFCPVGAMRVGRHPLARLLGGKS
ncbi:MAG: DUF362 domain-containing protein [Oscillospiraceae bacterium]|nr:DUF362 domain-containing protein [Oscillospiraceae bacterium]